MQQVAEVRRYWDSRLYWDTALFRISHRPATYCKKKKKNLYCQKCYWWKKQTLQKRDWKYFDV